METSLINLLNCLLRYKIHKIKNRKSRLCRKNDFVTSLHTISAPLYRLRYSEITSGRKNTRQCFGNKQLGRCATKPFGDERGVREGGWSMTNLKTSDTTHVATISSRHRALSNALPPQLKPRGGILSGNACCATHAHARAQDLCFALLALRGAAATICYQSRSRRIVGGGRPTDWKNCMKTIRPLGWRSFHGSGNPPTG